MPNSFLALIAASLVFLPATQSTADQLAPGQPFPILNLPLCKDEAETTTIEEFRGRKLMLHLFASW